MLRTFIYHKSMIRKLILYYMHILQQKIYNNKILNYYDHTLAFVPGGIQSLKIHPSDVYLNCPYKFTRPIMPPWSPHKITHTKNISSENGSHLSKNHEFGPYIIIIDKENR